MRLAGYSGATFVFTGIVNNTSARRYFMHKAWSGTDTGLRIEIDASDKLSIGVRTVSGETQRTSVSSSAITQGVKTTIIVTIDLINGFIRGYQDGLLITETTSIPFSNTTWQSDPNVNSFYLCNGSGVDNFNGDTYLLGLFPVAADPDTVARMFLCSYSLLHPYVMSTGYFDFGTGSTSRQLTSSISSATTSADSDFIIARLLLSSILSATTSTDAQASVNTIRALSSTISSDTTSTDAAFVIARAFLSSILSDTTSTDATATTANIRSLSSSISSATTSTDTAHTIARALVSVITSNTTALDAAFIIHRALQTSISSNTTSTDAVASIEGGITLQQIYDLLLTMQAQLDVIETAVNESVPLVVDGWTAVIPRKYTG
jgi:hypothetical protein